MVHIIALTSKDDDDKVFINVENLSAFTREQCHKYTHVRSPRVENHCPCADTPDSRLFLFVGNI